MAPNDIAVAHEETAKALDRKAELLQRASLIVEAGIGIFSHRALTFFGILCDAIMFGWVMTEPRWERVASAALFAVAVWFLVKFEGVKHGS